MSFQKSSATTWIDDIPALPYTVPFAYDFGNGLTTYDNYFFYQNSGAIVLVYVAQGYTFPSFFDYYSGYLTSNLTLAGNNLRSFRLLNGQWNAQGDIYWLDPDKNGWPLYPSCPLFYSTIDFYFTGNYDYDEEYCGLGHLTTGKFFTANISPSVGLTVVRSPESGGVASLPEGEGIYCGIDGYDICQLPFDLDSEVQLEAFPNSGWSFAYWDDGANQYTDNPHAFMMDSAKTVVAKFFRTFQCTSGVFDVTTGDECVIYVRNETGILPAGCNGEAADCFDQAQEAGYATGNEPRESAIIVFDRVPNTPLSVGHVGIVTGFNGNQVSIHDSNWVGYHTIGDHTETIGPGGYAIKGYIYCTP